MNSLLKSAAFVATILGASATNLRLGVNDMEIQEINKFANTLGGVGSGAGLESDAAISACAKATGAWNHTVTLKATSEKEFNAVTLPDGNKLNANTFEELKQSAAAAMNVSITTATKLHATAVGMCTDIKNDRKKHISADENLLNNDIGPLIKKLSELKCVDSYDDAKTAPSDVTTEGEAATSDGEAAMTGGEAAMLESFVEVDANVTAQCAILSNKITVLLGLSEQRSSTTTTDASIMTQFGTFVARVSEEKIHMLTLFNTCMTTASTLFHTEKKAATDQNKTEVDNAKAIQTKADGELVSTLDSLMQENTKSVDAKATEMKEMCLHEIVPEDLHEIVPEDLHEIVPEDPHESVPPEDPPVDSDQNCNAILSRNAAQHCNRLTVGEWCIENTKSTAIATVATKNTRSVPARAFIMPSITLFELLPNVRDLLPKIAADAGDLPELRLPHFQLGQYPLLNVSGLTLASVADIKLPGIPLGDFPGIDLPVGSPFAGLNLPSITVANYPRISTIGGLAQVPPVVAATTLAPQSNGNTPYPQSNGDTPAMQINGNTLVPQSTLQQELDALRTTTDEDHARIATLEEKVVQQELDALRTTTDEDHARIATLEEELAADGATPATRTNGNTPPPQTKQSAKAAEQKQWVHKTAASKPSSTDESSAVGEERGSTNSENNNQAETPNKGATSDSSLTKGILIAISVALVGGVMVALCVLYVKKSKEHARRRLMMGAGGENDLNKQSIPNLDSSDVSDPGWTDQELESDVESQLAIQEQGK